MQAALLSDRGVVRVSGEPARKFLDGLITADLDTVTPQTARYAALLTPQGKIIADFIVVEAPAEDGGGFFLDVPRALAQTLTTRLAFYRLRAKVAIDDMSESVGVMAIWDGGDATSEHGLSYTDPRLPALGQRMLVPRADAAAIASEIGATLASEDAYEAHRIALAVPRGGIDFAYNDAFPHEAGMDDLRGVDFDKGCYVGQEVVSRMHHRGSVRTRIVGVALEDFAPEAGVPVLAGEKPAGSMGSAANGRGIALVRLDRIADAVAAGQAITAGGLTVRPSKPGWARFAWPGDASAAE